MERGEGCRTHWIWNGDIPLHEWQTLSPELTINLVMWIFEGGSFVPCGQITKEGNYSIVTDYLGTPMEMCDEAGNKNWQAQLDIYGRVRTFEGSYLSDCPFRYQEQYQDTETGLYYNRLRYYDPDMGSHISNDPIGLAGNNPVLYSYVEDP